MSVEYVGTFEPGSPEWFAAREGACGGSDVAAILGLSKWESPFSLWHRMAGKLGPQDDNDVMRAGRFLEDGICASFADEQGRALYAGGLWRSVERPWQIASPDRFVEPVDDAPPNDILEAKLALYPHEWGEPGTDQIPPYYLTQCRWYLDVFDAKRCWVHVFIGSTGEFRTYIVEPDQADQAFMRDKVRAFLDTIERGERPSIDGHDATYSTVRKLHPEIDPIDVEIDPLLAEQYRANNAAKKAATKEAQRTAALVLDAIGNGRRALALSEPVAIRVPGRGNAAPFLRPCKEQ